MRIRIKCGKVRLFFLLPLSVIKSKLAYKLIVEEISKQYRNTTTDGNTDGAHCSKENNLQTECDNDQAISELSSEKSLSKSVVIDRVLMRKFYCALKKLIKTNGHFTLVDVCVDNEKTRVKITI